MSKQHNKHSYKKQAARSIWPFLLALITGTAFLSIWLVPPPTAVFAANEATRIAYWQLEENGADYIDNEQSLAGTCVDCPTRVTGQVGFGQAFNGSSTAISVDADPTFNWTTDDSFTIELWLKTDANACASGHQYALARGSSGSGHWAIGCSATTGTARFELSTTTDSTVTLESTRVISDGNWHHLVAIYDAGEGSSTLYLDRTDIVSATTGFTPNTDFTPPVADLHMGRSDSGSFFAGVLDEVALYNGRLSQDLIGAHYYLSRPYNNLCSPDIRIMPLGDSITRGTRESDEINERDSNYRKPLYLSLTADMLAVDFVGQYFTGNSTFDAHHQARSGAKAEEKASVIYDKLGNLDNDNNPADIILVHLGTNDLKNGDFTPAQTVGHIETLLDEIDRYDEKITVILAQIINHVDGEHQPTTDYNTLLEPFVAERLANGDKLILVNMETGANLDYRLAADGGDMLDDGTGVHPVTSGYEKIAAVWYDALIGFLSVCANVSAPNITSTPVTGAIVGEPYSYQVTASGIPLPTFSLITYPDGMIINETTGVISWTPTISGTFPVTVRASNEAGVANQSFTIEVWQEPVITSTPLLTATVDEPYIYQVTAVGAPTPVYTLTVKPEGMSIDATTGLITWTPAITGTFAVTVVAENDAGDHSQSFVIEVWQEPAITSIPVLTATVGESYSYQITAVGDPTPVYTLTTSPAGMSIDETTGLITWTPAISGTFAVTVTASNAVGEDSQIFMVDVWQAAAIISTPVTTATVGELYSYQVTAAGNPAPVYALTHSPAGMEINETTGLITWTPVVSGTYALTVTASNAAGEDSQSFTIEVWQEPLITSTPLLTATVGQPYSYQVTAVGHPTPGYALTTNPAGMSINAMTGLISWTPASPGSFNVTVLASNGAGTDEQSFIIIIEALPPTSYRLFLPIVIGN